ncbi:MAG TPA: sigma-54 dependent transcriptional regulator [Bacteroidota bacterium]|nr:sigma-54 dependent transcriptional regulator [Bacteroidota bacterium]
MIAAVDRPSDYWNEVSDALRKTGVAFKRYDSVPGALEGIASASAPLLILNADQPALDEAIVRLREQYPRTEIRVIADAGNPDEAERAVKSGAWDYVARPPRALDLISILQAALRYAEARGQEEPSPGLAPGDFEGIVGESPELKNCLAVVARAAGSDANVLIRGETGTGKELVALAIHRNSSRRNNNFVVVDCAGLPENLVESTLFGHERGAFTGADRSQVGLVKQADGGTLFLDEIGELPQAVQRSFLRVIQERRFRPIGGKDEVASDFRLISATNRDLDAMVGKMEFREDLLFRIRSFAIELPPLRNRMDDIKDIVSYHLPRICDRMGIRMKRVSPEFSDRLLSYGWPGNVRELVSALERSVVAARFEPALFPQHLPTYLRVKLARSAFETGTVRPPSAGLAHGSEPLPALQVYRDSVTAIAEREYLLRLLAETNGDTKEACRVSHISRSRFYSLLKKHGISLRAKFTR